MGTRGPAKNPQALRRSRDGDRWIRLPAHGLTAEHDVPAWPIEAGEPDAVEHSLWMRLWREAPAAWLWLERGLNDQVAVYVRMWRTCMQSPVAAQVAEMRRQGDALMLTVPGMHRFAVTIDSSLDGPVNGLDAPERPKVDEATVTRLPSSRERFGNGGTS